ncbi:exodeoxyribonuclease V subunit gamma [Solicola gregarius]|uniref:RecBCD enzyme subunit RecC n=1 Tax=Solicola gregarius TaxID=2908642 RepID=A0AA46YJT0_9ACTN|nr:exodeoxyribonuclease V subunit gamma [Solicola gregarius]UYM04677.1 exodeoxyribonuclease V subunit gamma [Solicola gregarius]
MLRLHRAERADALVRGLADVLATPPDDPFTPEVVAVPSQGVERWIAQRLSTVLGTQPGRGDGICANVGFPSPRRLVADVLAGVLDLAPDDDPWLERRLVWPLLAVIDASVHEPWAATLGRHLGARERGTDNGRRVAVAQKLAGLFTAYGADRPGMVRAWVRGDDADGAGSGLATDLAWQAEIWRRLRIQLAVESPAERLDDACQRLRDEPDTVGLPPRLSLFGPTRLTTEQLDVLDALAEHRDVHLWLPHPSHGLWRRLADRSTQPAVRRDDTTAALPQHPLVRSMARDSREMQLRLTPHVPPGGDAYLGDDEPATSLLGRLQRDIHDDRAPQGGYALDDADRSIQVHACHGRQRQVEVLREAILGLLADDPALEPRDIIVMCPDIENWAPLITATFGLAETEQAHPGQQLQIRLADRSLRQTNPVLSVIARLLDLADGRMAASEILDLAAMPPVRRRFGYDDDALERIGDWVRRSGVRWGFDAQHRSSYGLGAFNQNTWRSGLDRVLTGVAMADDDLQPLGLALPLDDVDSTEIDLAGRFAELVDRVTDLTDRLHGHHSLETWIDTLLDAVDLLADAPPAEQWQILHARRQLTDALRSAGDLATRVRVVLADVRALLASRLRGRPTRANFRTGHLTICTMVPMRSVPHRVVCLLGLDDGAFPRAGRIDGDDVLARTPLVGERDPRSEDRQLFLDAVLAAREHLVICYTGADERTGAVRPPAVPVGELLDALDQTVDGSVRERVLVRHPLQPFDVRNFESGALGHDGPFSFDAAAYAGARASLGARAATGVFLQAPLDPEPPGVVELDELIRFLEHPARAFLRQRLGLSTLPDVDETADALPIDVAPLESWEIGDRLLDARLRGIDRGAAVRAEWLRGGIPPGRLGQARLDPIVADVESLVTATVDLHRTAATTVEIDVDVGEVRLVGAVTGVHQREIVRIVYSKLGAKHRVRAWAQLLALAAARPEQRWTTATVGRRRGGVSIARIADLEPETARTTLASLISLYAQGLREPLPIPPKTACAYAERRRRGVRPEPSAIFAAQEWRKSANNAEFGEFDDDSHRRVWGDVAIDALLAQPPVDGTYDEPHRFGQLARRVWDPLLAAEEVSEQ